MKFKRIWDSILSSPDTVVTCRTDSAKPLTPAESGLYIEVRRGCDLALTFFSRVEGPTFKVRTSYPSLEEYLTVECFVKGKRN